MDRKIEVVSYKGCIIDYVPKRKGYLVYMSGHHRIDYVFDDIEEAKLYVDTLPWEGRDCG